MTDETKRSGSTVRLLALAAVLGIAAGVAAIYVRSATDSNQGALACTGNQKAIERMKPLARGEVAGILVPDRPRALPELTFVNAQEKPLNLADFAGKTVLLNIWATWCVPCREEMPNLDRVQSELGSDKFEVVAVSIDLDGFKKSVPFLEELKLANIDHYAEPTGKLFQALKIAGRAVGLPTTLIIDGSGCEIGYLPGPAVWDSEDGKALIRAAVGEVLS